MKKISVQYFEKQENKKLIHYLESYSPDKAIIIFDHGLGDIVEFLSIFETIQKDYPKWDLYLGVHETIDYSILHKKIYKLSGKELNPQYVLPFGKGIVQDNVTIFARYDLDEIHKKFKFIFNIVYRDWRHPLKLTPAIINRSKNDICMVNEIGYPEGKKLVQYELPFKDKLNTNNKNVSFHTGGFTDKSIKNPSTIAQESIWNEIIQAGYNPIDIHINNVSTIVGTNIDLPKYIDPKNSIRNQNGGLQLVIDTMLSSKFVVGILSGPLHLANILHGSDNCLGLEGQFKISNYINSNNLEVVNICPYIDGSVYNWLKNKG